MSTSRLSANVLPTCGERDELMHRRSLLTFRTAITPHATHVCISCRHRIAKEMSEDDIRIAMARRPSSLYVSRTPSKASTYTGGPVAKRTKSAHVTASFLLCFRENHCLPHNKFYQYSIATSRFYSLKFELRPRNCRCKVTQGQPVTIPKYSAPPVSSDDPQDVPRS